MHLQKDKLFLIQEVGFLGVKKRGDGVNGYRNSR